MPRAKSMLVSMEITLAGNSHDCRFDNRHRIKKGMYRLTIKEDRDRLNYCLKCAKEFIDKGLVSLRDFESKVSHLLANETVHLPEK